MSVRLMHRLFSPGFVLLLMAGCAGSETEPAPSPDAVTYDARGVLESVTTDSSYLTIHHEAIPGYMDEMTMTFVLADTARVPSLSPGDTIMFRLTSGAEGDRIHDVRVAVP